MKLMRSTLKRTFFFLVVALVFVVTFVVRTNANGAQFIVNNENNADVNFINFKRYEYVGQCPGVVIAPDSHQARFTSSSTRTATNRRAIVRNVTEGMDSNPYPYTDREYDKNQYSQGFNFKLGNSHKNQTFSVLEGDNKFEYEIKDGNKVIERGEFTAAVSIKDVGVFAREAICQEENTCHEEYEYYEGDCGDKGKDRRRRYTRQVCRPLTKCKCPS